VDSVTRLYLPHLLLNQSPFTFFPFDQMITHYIPLRQASIPSLRKGVSLLVLLVSFLVAGLKPALAQQSLTLVAAASSTTVCLGSTVSLSVTISNATTPSTYTYTWSAPGGASVDQVSTQGTSSTSNVVSATITTAGVKTFTVTAVDGSGGAGSTTISITPTPPTITFTASQTVICGEGQSTLIATGGSNYQFDRGFSGIQSGTTNTASVAYSGTYSVTVTTAGGCSATASLTIAEGDEPEITFGASTSSVCEGAMVVVPTQNEGGPVSGYQWYKDGSPVSGQTSATLTLSGVTPAQAGEYTLEVTSECGPTRLENTFTLTVTPGPGVTLKFGNSVLQFNNPTPTINLNSLTNAGVLVRDAQGNTADRYYWSLAFDIVGNYEISEGGTNDTGYFPINHAGRFKVTVYKGQCQTTQRGFVTVGQP
jgi:hypothetical protein